MTGAQLVESWLAEERTPFAGWDFSHIDGRAIEDPLPWSYLDIVRSRLMGARSLLDLGTGGGEVLSRLQDAFPPRVVAAEAYEPNVGVARGRLAPLGVDVVTYEADDKALALIEERWADKSNGRIQGNVGEILVRSDSQLVVNQVNGQWRVEDSKLIELSEEARDSLKKLGPVRLEWVPREENYAGLWLEGKLKPLSVERIRG